MKKAEMPVPIARLNSLWREQGNIAVTEKEDPLTISEPYPLPQSEHLFSISGSGLKPVMEVLWLAVNFTAKPLHYIQ
jgi:hypothetical protein